MFKSALLSLVALGLLAMGQAAVRRDNRTSDNDSGRGTKEKKDAEMENMKTEVKNMKTRPDGAHRHDEVEAYIDERMAQMDGRMAERDAEVKEMKAKNDAEVKNIKTSMKEMKAKNDAEMKNIKTSMKEMEAKKDAEVKELKTNVKEVKAELEERTRTVIKCAYKHHWTPKSGTTLTYNRLIADFNSPNGGDGRLDLDTGVFTCLSAGFYTISYSGTSILNAGKLVYLHLYHNGQNLPEGSWHVLPAVSAGVPFLTQGARTLILHLKVGDTIEIRGASGSSAGQVYDFTFCITMTQP